MVARTCYMIDKQHRHYNINVSEMQHLFTKMCRNKNIILNPINIQYIVQAFHRALMHPFSAYA